MPANVRPANVRRQLSAGKWAPAYVRVRVLTDVISYVYLGTLQLIYCTEPEISDPVCDTVYTYIICNKAKLI